MPQKNLSQREKEIAIHKRAHKGLVDYFYVHQADQETYLRPAPFHYSLSDKLLKEKGHYAAEWFRESGKTSLVLKAFPLYKLTYPDPECRYIVIIKNNQELASAKLAEISSEYQSNPLVGHNKIEVKKDSAKVFEATVRGMKKQNTDVRIEAYGKGTSIRGLSWGIMRPQIIICDDLQDLEDAESETVQEKDWNWFLSDVMFLAKTGRVFIIGNNLGGRCIIERLMADDMLGFEKMRISALDENDEASWPEAFSKQFLLEEKAKFTSLGKLDIWYRERMCVAMAEEDQIFKKEYFKHFEQRDIEGKSLEYYLTADLAISQKQGADETVLCVVGKEPNKPEWYLVEFVAGKLDPLQTIDALFMLYQRYRPSRIGIESVAYQKALLYFITEEQRKRQIYFDVTELKNLRAKELRIKGLQPLFKAGVIYHRQNMTKLEQQLLTFPKGLHDDWIDALAMMIDLIDGTTTSTDQAYNRAVSGLIQSQKNTKQVQHPDWVTGKDEYQEAVNRLINN